MKKPKYMIAHKGGNFYKMKKKFVYTLLISILLLNILSVNVKAANFDIDFDISTESISLVNLDTDMVVFERNPNQKRSMASITKIMTYIVTVENIEDLEGTKVKIGSDVIDVLLGTDSSIAGLKKDQELSVMQLLNCLMVPSGNDAALVLANYIGNGDVSKFVDMMNKKAAELSCENTHFMNPHGLYDKNHYTTVNDVIKMTKYAMKLPHFMEISTQVVSYALGDDNPLVTTNSMIDLLRGGDYYYKYARGIKTGHLDESGYCLVSTAVRKGYTYLCVALGAPSVDSHNKEIETNGAMVDSKNLYMWAFENLEMKSITDSSSPMGEIKLKYVFGKDTMIVVPARTYATILPNDIDVSAIEIRTNLPDSIEAPIMAGTKVGTADLIYNGHYLSTIDLVASESEDRSDILYAFAMIVKVITSKWFLISASVIIILIAIYVIVSLIHNRKNRGRVKKYRSF